VALSTAPFHTMENVPPQVWAVAHTLIARNETGNSTSSGVNAATPNRPPTYKAIGLSLAVASGLFIGTSFVLKKMGLLKANTKYNEEAGEGYGYLKNAWWWGGMSLMIVGEICNFVAYAFVDAILVTPLGALSVVVTTILSAIFLKERLSFVGKVGCFNCIIGSIVIVLNAPEQSAVADIQEMQHFVIAPGFLSYAGVVIVACTFIALWAGPRYGKKSMLVYLSICSFIGGLSVVATQGLGSAIVAQASGKSQFNQWFLYVLLVFVVATLLTEIIYLNVSYENFPTLSTTLTICRKL
jgi:magnesium transporter